MAFGVNGWPASLRCGPPSCSSSSRVSRHRAAGGDQADREWRCRHRDDHHHDHDLGEDPAHLDHHHGGPRLGERGRGERHACTAGLAGYRPTVLAAQGWAMQTAVDASTTEQFTAVYYAAGQQASADAVATTLGLKLTNVSALTAAVPVAGVSGDDVVVVIGTDLAGA